MSDMSVPALSGLHHLKLPVSNLDVSIAWYKRVFGAHHRTEFDHRIQDGALYAVMLSIPGLDVLIELRLAPKAAKAVAGYDPITFGVANRAALEKWIAHLNACEVDHSPLLAGYVGHVVIFADPDGLMLRLYTNPERGFAEAKMASRHVDIDSPWLNPPLMSSDEV